MINGCWINDSPSTVQQYLGFTTTPNDSKLCHDLFTFPLVHSAPLNTIAPTIATTSTLVVERLKPYKIILVPRAYDPSGLQQESTRALDSCRRQEESQALGTRML